MKLFYFILISVMLYSCSDNFEQSYEDFTEFDQASLRLKSWFPPLTATDCYNFKEIHNLNNNNSFGRFSYRNTFRIDSLLSDSKTYEKISLDSVSIFIKKIKSPKYPSWFLIKEKIPGKIFYKNGLIYLIKYEEERTIYFVYSSK